MSSSSLTTEGYLRFLRACGHRTVSTGDVSWYDASRFVYMAAPPHRSQQPTEAQLRAILRHPGCVGVRFAAPLEGPGKLSYQLSCANPSYGLESLSSNTRSKVRRGLRRCTVEPVPFETIREAGRKANEDTVARQGREGALEGARWDAFFAAAGATPGFEGWGAWVDGQLAAFLVTVTFPEAVEFMLARSSNDTLGAYPNNALVFTVTEEMLVRRKAAEITFGLESLEPVEALDQFKYSMGFVAKPIRQRIELRPALRMLLRRRPIRSLAMAWARRRGHDAGFWRKAEGLIRFAEQGGL